MKKKYLVLAGCLTLAFAAPAIADGPYVGVQAGATFLKDSEFSDFSGRLDAEYDPGYTVGGVVGYKMSLFRIEGELSYRQNDWDDITDLSVGAVSIPSVSGLGLDVDAEQTALSFMANAFVDFENPTPFTPFVMAGIGAAYIDLDDFSVAGVSLAINEDDTVFAYQVGAGVAMGFTEALALSLEYRYFATGDPELGVTEGDYESHNAIAGVRLFF